MSEIATRPLGRTGMEITGVGLGAWAIGGEWLFGWGSQDDDESVSAIHHSVESGINWIDTAPAYGFGHSEEVVARAIRGLPEADRPFLFTKAGLVWDEDAVARDRMAIDPAQVANPMSLRREAEASLRRLRVERIDLYQLHWPPDDGTPIEEYWATFAELKREGKVRAIGLCNHGVPELEAAEAVAHVDSVQPPLSMLEREAASDVVPWCDDHATGVIVYSPMGSGLLSGRWTTERSASLDPGDWRAKEPAFHGEDLAAALGLVEALRPIAERHETTVAAVAIAWTLAFKWVTGAIVGARSPRQIDGWVGAADLEFDDAELDEMASAIKRSGLGAGPLRP
jgi:aryl-alcohol dehydrogenase-like predicted oxidoreductase